MRRIARMTVVCSIILFSVGVWLQGAPGRGPDTGSGAYPGTKLGQRVRTLRVAGRYHLRTRTRRFFQRSASRNLAQPSEIQRTAARRPHALGAERQPDATDVAGRYHLRTRTQRFFGRLPA